MAEMGVHSVAYAFPKVRIITTAVDKEVNDQFHIIPGIGEDPGAGSTRDPLWSERLSPLIRCCCFFSLPRQFRRPILWHRRAVGLVWKWRGDGLLMGDAVRRWGRWGGRGRFFQKHFEHLDFAPLRLAASSTPPLHTFLFHFHSELLAPPPPIQVLLHPGVGIDSVLL